MNPLFWKLLADITVTLHVAFVAFVVAGQLLILIGAVRGWSWIRNVWFRGLHLAAIVVVVLEAWAGVTCPLTVWEQDFRARAGQTSYTGDFIAHWLHELLFFEDVPEHIFTACYSAFGAAVLLTFWLAPPRRSCGAPLVFDK
ncbi:MAG: DUF2784 domain-containing protein [Planctomyces sp.]|nr:DUF2784 domain-containing protein [Planctomyces sp.]